MKHRSLVNLGAVLLLLVAGGANCHRFLWQPAAPPPPIVLTPTATLPEVIAAINANRARAMSLYCDHATISGSGFPSMRTQLAIASPRHMRLRASTGLTGAELDLGSNDQIFWIWVKRNQPPMTVVGHHDQFAASPAAQIFPIRPEWLVEAIGLVYLDPQAQHIGPIRRSDGRLEIQTPIETPAGRQLKVLVLDPQTALVYEQHLLDPQGKLIASAVNRGHLVDAGTGLVLPRDTTVSWPALGMNLRLELNDVRVNPLDLGPQMWTKPQYPGYPDVDVATAIGAPPGSAQPLAPGIPPAANPGATFAPPGSGSVYPMMPVPGADVGPPLGR